MGEGAEGQGRLWASPGHSISPGSQAAGLCPAVSRRRPQALQVLTVSGCAPGSSYPGLGLPASRRPFPRPPLGSQPPG